MSNHFIKMMLPHAILTLVAIGVLAVNFQWIYILYSILGFYLLGVFGNSIGFHRYLTHQSFEVSKFWHYTFILLGSLTGQGSAIFWTALHLHHHRTSDSLKDIHTPVKGLWSSTWGWQISGNFDTAGFFAPRKLYKDPILKFLHEHYYKSYWLTALLLFLIDPYFFLFFMGFGGYFLVSLGDNSSNYCFHSPKFGYKTYDTGDNSRNVPFTSWYAFGANWHNNHHNNPRRYRFGERPNETDPAAWIIEKIKNN